MEGARVDLVAGKATLVPGFAKTEISEIAGFPDGGFVVKGGVAEMTSDDRLTAFDSQGKRLWSLPGNGDLNDPAALFSPKDVAVTTDGKVAVVDVIGKTVQLFDRAGKHGHTVDLKKAWGREPAYPSDISADRDGGVVVQDFQGNPPIVQMKADGTVRAEVKPRLKDGGTFRLSDAQVAPDGVLWVSDGHALYRLVESGTAHRVLGEPPDPRRFDEAAALTLDAKGQIYAVVARTGAVHVFRPDGRWLACACRKRATCRVNSTVRASPFLRTATSMSASISWEIIDLFTFPPTASVSGSKPPSCRTCPNVEIASQERRNDGCWDTRRCI